MRVRTQDATTVTRLFALGFRPHEGDYAVATASEPEMAHVMMALRDAGVAFERGREWSPAEVFEDLRDRGLLSGPFRSLSWRGPGDWVAREG